jgi:polysaccharide biosynthesis transport protein
VPPDAAGWTTLQGTVHRVRVQLMAERLPDSSARGTDFKQLLMLLRRRIGLAAGVAAFTVFVVALFVFLERPLYRSTATVRLAYPRRALAVGVEDLPEAKDRGSDPLLSLIELLRGRAIVGAVVDSLGLRLQPLDSWFRGSSRAVRAALRDIRVSPHAQADTLRIRFEADRVIARGRQWEAQAPYGKPLVIGAAQFSVPFHPRVAAAALVVRAREEVIDDVLKVLAVVRRKSTDIVDITYSDPDPFLAQRVANLLVRVFQARDAGSAQEQARSRAEFLAAQLRANDSAMTVAQAQLSAFRRQRLLGNSGDRLAAEQSRLTALDTRRGELEAERSVYESFLAKVNTANDSLRLEALRDLSYTPELAADPVVSRMSQQVLVYQTRLDSLTTGPLPAAPTNPDVLGLQAVIRSTQEELGRAVRAHLTSIGAQSQALAALRSRTGVSFQPLPATEAAAMRLEQLVENLRSTGDRIRQEHENARMAEAISAGDAQVIDWAPLPYRPAGIPPWAKVGLGTVLGLLLGCGAAALAESGNTSIMRPEELERTLNVRELGVIPPLLEPSANGHGRRSHSFPFLTAARRRPEADNRLGAEAFRLVYAGLTFGWGEGRRTILVTSAAPREGKTLIAANLAFTFAREGVRVLLVDCDLRRPRLHRVFAVPAAPGLIELLRADGAALAPAADALLRGAEATVAPPIPGIRRTKFAGLSLLPCGALTPHAHELLKPQQFRSLLNDLSGHFDVTILDTPPLLVSADAALLAPLTDGAILVVRSGQTDRASAERACQYLIAAGAHFLGAVLNDPAGELARYGKYYYPYAYLTPSP